MLKPFLAVAFIATLLVPATAEAKRIRFSGYDFNVKQGEGLGPGPNSWAISQAFVDSKGRLHLRFSKKKGKWYAGEIQSVSRFGFGKYEIEFTGDIGGQDKNVVFGFFNYPPADVGPDATNEIDIEFARWGNKSYPPLNYTVWPVDPGLKAASQSFSFKNGVAKSEHKFVWEPNRVSYYSVVVRDNGTAGQEAYWSFKPKNPGKRISSSPMPIFFNLWGFRGQEPSDGENVEVIVNSFKFTPAE
jgi:hypothetical protein